MREFYLGPGEDGDQLHSFVRRSQKGRSPNSGQVRMALAEGITYAGVMYGAYVDWRIAVASAGLNILWRLEVASKLGIYKL